VSNPWCVGKQRVGGGKWAPQCHIGVLNAGKPSGKGFSEQLGELSTPNNIAASTNNYTAVAPTGGDQNQAAVRVDPNITSRLP
jgi:hypothetical protein